MIDQTLARAGIDPSRVPPERIDEVLQKLGVDPRKVPESVKKKFKMSSPAATKPVAAASAARSRAGGRRMSRASRMLCKPSDTAPIKKGE